MTQASQPANDDGDQSTPDNIGKWVDFGGDVWQIVAVNYLGAYDLARFETREDGRFKIGTSCKLGLSKDHPHYAVLVDDHWMALEIGTLRRQLCATTTSAEPSGKPVTLKIQPRKKLSIGCLRRDGGRGGPCVFSDFTSMGQRICVYCKLPMPPESDPPTAPRSFDETIERGLSGVEVPDEPGVWWHGDEFDRPRPFFVHRVHGDDRLGVYVLDGNGYCVFSPITNWSKGGWHRASPASSAQGEIAALKQQITELQKESADKSKLFGEVCDGVMRDCLIAIAGAVCTPEKGYKEDGGFNQMLADIRLLRKQHDALQKRVDTIRDALPSTFYAGLKLELRIGMMVQGWRGAIEALNKLQADGIPNEPGEVK